MTVASSVKTRTRYIHQEIGKDVLVGIAIRYVPLQETVLDYNGRKVLYAMGQTYAESSCCAVGDWTNVVVPGYIVGWKDSASEDGLPVSEVEPVTDPKAREELSGIIQAKEGVLPIEFW